MATSGNPQIGQVDGEGLTVAVVTSQWNADICDRLHARALATGEAAGAQIEEYRVPGAMELPVVVNELAAHVDAVVALGCVIQGGTPHFDYVCRSVTDGLTRIALDHHIPVGNGVLTVHTYDQAIERAGGPGSVEDKGAEAMVAALYTARQLSHIRKMYG